MELILRKILLTNSVSVTTRTQLLFARVILLALVVSFTPTASALEFELKGDTRCAWGSKDCNRCVNDVKANFNAIETHFRGKRASKIRVKSYAYDTKGYILHRIHATYEHIQGIGRIAGLGNDEYLVFTHSTNSGADGTPGPFGSATHGAGKSGALAVIRMGANQNSRGFELGDLSEGAGSDQNIHNRTVARTYSDSNHPGGLATVGHYVFVADWCQPHGAYAWCDDPSQYAFEVYDVSNADQNRGRINSNPPIRIIDRSVYVAGDSVRSKSTASVAATRLKSGKYLVGIGRSGGRNYEYFLSNTTSLSSRTKWSSTGSPENIAKWGEGAAMVNECGSGDIYLFQFENSGTRFVNSKDEVHLFQLKKNSNSGRIVHQYINSRTFRCSDGTPWCNFDKGVGTYISPTGNLYLYATDAQQAKSTERFRMMEFGNYRETGYSTGQGTNKSCENPSIATCNKHGAKCMVVHTLSGIATDVCHWPSKNTAATCKGAHRYWTPPGSKYAKNHPDAIPPGSSGICNSEVKNLRNVKPAVDVSALIDAIAKMPSAQFHVYEAQTPGTVSVTAPSADRAALLKAIGQTPTARMHVSEAPTPGTGGLAAPSHLTISDVSGTSLTLEWMDNATNENGVSVERSVRVQSALPLAAQWEHVFNVEELAQSRVKGTGRRTDGDDGLNPKLEYCYRLRAYRLNEFSAYSDPVCMGIAR